MLLGFIRWIFERLFDRARDAELAELRSENERLREENRQLVACIVEIETSRYA